MDVPVSRNIPASEDVPISKARPTALQKRALIDSLRRVVAARVTPGPSAARSQDFLYDDDGLPL
ncbi:MAG: hypothetical protein H7840_03885 [Alphaproteobacteria bacterium]